MAGTSLFYMLPCIFGLHINALSRVKSDALCLESLDGKMAI